MEPVTPGTAIQVHATTKSKPRIEITRQISLNRPTSLSMTPVKPFIKAPGHKSKWPCWRRMTTAPRGR